MVTPAPMTPVTLHQGASTPITLPLAMMAMPVPQAIPVRVAPANQVRRLSVPTATSAPMSTVILLTVNVFTPITLPLAMMVMPVLQGTPVQAVPANPALRLSVPTVTSVPMKAVILL